MNAESERQQSGISRGADMLARMVVVVGLAIAGGAHAQAPNAEQWLCEGELATGLALSSDGQRWQVSPTRAGSKFAIRPPRQSEGTTPFVVFDVGAGKVAAICAAGFNGDMLHCGQDHVIGFSRSTLRFQSAWLFGYVGRQSRDVGPLIEIGRCSPL